MHVPPVGPTIMALMEKTLGFPDRGVQVPALAVTDAPLQLEEVW
jgi:hypothetical protein